MDARLPYPCEVTKYDDNEVTITSKHPSCDHAYREYGFDKTMGKTERQMLRKKNFGPEGSGLIIIQRGNTRYEIKKL